jgi:threonine dehydratase
MEVGLLALVKEAFERIKTVVNPTPIVYSTSLSRMHGLEIYLKLENLQKTGSFKVRGAYNKIFSLSEEQKKRGVIAASSGNHAQGVAWAAGLLGVSSVIVMPEATPIVKQVATKAYGGEVILHGKTFDAAYHHALDIARQKKLAFIHPFDDELIMAGQGTIGLEIMDELPEVETVVVPVGGGGLISGIASVLKGMKRGVNVYGIEASASTTCKASLVKGRPVAVETAPTIADGIAIKKVGERTLPVIQRYVDGVVDVGEECIAAAILRLLERKKLIVEGAGAVPLAALMEEKIPRKGKKVLLVLSGGNIDVTTLDRILRIGLMKEGRIMRLTTVVPDVPGTLARLAGVIAALKSNILHITHQREAVEVPVGWAKLEIILEVEGPEHIERVKKGLKEKGYAIEG